jgi:hypothetical protein
MNPERLEEIRQAYLKETNVTGFWRSAVGELLKAQKDVHIECKPFFSVIVTGLYEWQGVECPHCHTPIALRQEHFKGGSSTTMHIRHLQTNSSKCPMIL